MQSVNLPTLVEEIKKVFEGRDLSERIVKLTSKLGLAFVSKFLEYAEERKPTLRLSNVGKPLRQLWYDLKGYKGEELPPEAKLKFLYGAICEELVLFLCEEAGYKLVDEQRQVDFNGVKGHIDGILNGVLVDVKSCSPASFNKFEYGKLYEQDSFGYQDQLRGYKEAIKIEKASFIAINKVSGEICVLDLPEAKYNLTKKVETIKEILKSNKPPERCYKSKPFQKSGNEVLDVGCSYCPHKFGCWEDMNDGKGLLVRVYSTGPKFFTKLVREPKFKTDNNEEPFPTKEE